MTLNISFNHAIYPLSFFYDYDSIKIKEYSNKILLPQTILENITHDERIKFPLFFYIKHNERKIYLSVDKFVPDISDIFIPNHIFEQLGVDYGKIQELFIDYKSLKKGSKIVIQPHDIEFFKIKNPKLYFETHIQKSYHCLSQGDIIRLVYGDKFLDYNIIKTEPKINISTLDTDIEVEFEKPLNYVEPPIKEKTNIKKIKDLSYFKKMIKFKDNEETFTPFKGKGNKLGNN
jgi:ubiquitin fusion degradation protein 1